VPEASGRNSVHQSVAPPAGTAAADREVRLKATGLEVRLGRSGPDVVSDVSFAVSSGQVLGLLDEAGAGQDTGALDRAGPAGHAGQARSAGDRMAEVMRQAYLDPTPEMLRRYPHQLSGGQQQRVALAMAFACRPSLIVLDEPTTGLDVSTQRHILDTVRSLCRSNGVAAVYVSHDLAVVSGLVSEVAVMYAGRVVEIGSAARLFGEPAHPYTRGLIGAVPSPERAEVLTGIDGQQPRPGHRGAGCSFAARCDYAIGDCTTTVPGPVTVAGRSVRCLRAWDIQATHPERLPVVAGPPAPAGTLALSV